MVSFDTDLFKQAQERATDLKSTYSERDKLIDEMVKMYTLVDPIAEQTEQKFKSVINTRSPDAANAVETAVRLMTANYPGYNAPEELHNHADPEVLDTIESLAGMMMRQSDRVRGQPVHVDGARSGILTDEIIASVNSTAAMLEYAHGSKAVKRIERIARVTPFLFDVVHPLGCYYETDFSGVRSFCRRLELTGQQIVDQFGDDGKQALGGVPGSKKLSDRHVVWMSWDLDAYWCWIEDGGIPIAFREWEYSFVPWVVSVVEGSRIFNKVEEQRRPLLYTLHKSGMWSRQNIALSAIYTRVQTWLWGALQFETDDPGAPTPTIDTDSPLSIIRVEKGKLSPLPVDPKENALWQAFQLAQTLGEQSTIYKTTAGQALGPGATYSETALLSQAGRLPLVAVQRKLGWVLGDLVRMAFLWMKESKENTYTASEAGKEYVLDASLIPDDLEIEVTIDPTRPEDMLQQGQVVKALKGIVPDEYLYEHLLHVRQPANMIEDLWKQNYRDQLTAVVLQQLNAPPQQPEPPPDAGLIPGIPGAMADGGMGGPLPPAFEQGMEA